MLYCFTLLVSLSYFCMTHTLLYTMCSICVVLAGEAYFCKLDEDSLVQVGVHEANLWVQIVSTDKRINTTHRHKTQA